jgi:hypothetical protein
MGTDPKKRKHLYGFSFGPGVSILWRNRMSARGSAAPKRMPKARSATRNGRSPKMRFTRREVLAGLAGSTVVLIAPPFARAANSLIFSGDQQAIIDAAVERLLPGARAAGVPGYINYWLAQRPFHTIRRYMARGAKLLDQTAKKHHQKGFVACAQEAQDAVLAMVAKGMVRRGELDGKRFFEQLMTFTLEGFLSDPRYGGNRDRVGWRFIGIPDGLASCWWNPEGVRTVLDPEEGFHD